MRIRNTAVAINYRDVLMRKGIHAIKAFPSGIGLESAGVIDAMGPEVAGFAVGDRVAYAGMPEGSYAEFRIVPAARLIALPDGIDERTAASMMIRGMTARSLLFEAYKVQPGDTILIHAAAGGVGLIMCQWAKHLGATVIGTVSSDEKAAVARAHGCDHAIVYTREDFARRVREITGGRRRACRLQFRRQGDVRRLAEMPAPARRDGIVRRGLGRSRPDAAAAAGRARLDLPHPSQRLELHRDARGARRDGERSVRDGHERQDQDRDQQDVCAKDAPRAHADMEERKTTGSIVLVVYWQDHQIVSAAPPRSSARSTLIKTPKPFLSGSLFFSGSIRRFQISS